MITIPEVISMLGNAKDNQDIANVVEEIKSTVTELNNTTKTLNNIRIVLEECVLQPRPKEYTIPVVGRIHC